MVVLNATFDVRKQRMLFCVALLAGAMLQGNCDSRADEQRGFGRPRNSLPLRRFGKTDDEELLRRGFPKLAMSVRDSDRNQAANQFQKADLDGDGVITRSEWGDQPESRFIAKDLNRDGEISEYEQLLRLVQFRLGIENIQASKELNRIKMNDSRVPTKSVTDSASKTSEVAPTQGQEAQIRMLASIIKRDFDLNNDRVIQQLEFINPSTPDRDLSSADADSDGVVTNDELLRWIRNGISRRASSRLSPELQPYDLNQDGQVSIAEFAPKPSRRTLAQFQQLDVNRDGFVTPEEGNVVDTESSTYRSDRASVLRSSGTVVSEILLSDDIIINDLKVRVSLTSESDDSTELVLIGPDRRAVRLFAGGWSPIANGQLLENVLFDDGAAEIKPGQKTALRRAIPPPGARTSEESLSDWSGARGIGTWRLVIRNLSDQPGLLQGWSLIVTPKKGRRGPK